MERGFKYKPPSDVDMAYTLAMLSLEHLHRSMGPSEAADQLRRWANASEEKHDTISAATRAPSVAQAAEPKFNPVASETVKHKPPRTRTPAQAAKKDRKDLKRAAALHQRLSTRVSERETADAPDHPPPIPSVNLESDAIKVPTAIPTDTALPPDATPPSTPRKPSSGGLRKFVARARVEEGEENGGSAVANWPQSGVSGPDPDASSEASTTAIAPPPPPDAIAIPSSTPRQPPQSSMTAGTARDDKNGEDLKGSAVKISRSDKPFVFGSAADNYTFTPPRSMGMLMRDATASAKSYLVRVSYPSSRETVSDLAHQMVEKVEPEEWELFLEKWYARQRRLHDVHAKLELLVGGDREGVERIG